VLLVHMMCSLLFEMLSHANHLIFAVVHIRCDVFYLQTII